MKRWLIIISILVASFQSYGQEENIDFFFDEFGVSINSTNLKDENTENKFGFGIGIYHSFMNDKKINLIFGFEYNRTSQFKKIMYEGHFAHTTDLTYNLNNLSIPINIRFNVGNKTKVFLETGVFADLIISSKRKGTMHTYLPDQNNNIVYKEYEINEKADLASINYGFVLGLGLRIPLDKFEFTIKPDYRFGLRKLYSYQDNIYNRYIRLSVGLKKKN